MSDIAFENIAAEIAAGTITAQEIQDYTCAVLSNNEKVALLTRLAEKIVEDATPRKQAGVVSGIKNGPGSLEIPAFIYGGIQIIDTDDSATIDLSGSHQFVTDTLGDEFPESSSMEWPEITGKYYPDRVFTVPAGTTVLYTFVTNS